MLDPYRLTQILVNLVGNSAKFTDKGSITVSFRWIPRVIEINERCFQPMPYDSEDEGAFEREESNFQEEAYHFLQLNQKKLVYGKDKPPASYTGGILKIVVKNTGQGIIREDLEKLFQKFSQNCQELEYKKIGRGLELYITKEIIKAMYGEIRVYSKQGVGASFILCIPCKPTLIPQVLRPHSDPILPDKNRIMHTIRTMIVDDDSANTKVFEQYLAQKKIPTQCVAQNGLEAYERYKQQVFNGEPIELIIIDLNMPTIEGRTSCKRIRDYEKEHNLKPCIIIVFSGNCIESEMNECLDPKGDIQAHEFLRKPIQYEEFSAAVDRVANKIV